MPMVSVKECTAECVWLLDTVAAELWTKMLADLQP